MPPRPIAWFYRKLDNGSPEANIKATATRDKLKRLAAGFAVTAIGSALLAETVVSGMASDGKVAFSPDTSATETAKKVLINVPNIPLGIVFAAVAVEASVLAVHAIQRMHAMERQPDARVE